jgi:general secretion pathway protein J
MVLLMGAFRIGARAWEKGDKGIEQRQRICAVLNLLNDQIKSISLRQTLSDNLFIGDSKSLEFVSRKSLYPESDNGEIQVKYMVKKETDSEEALLLSEKKPSTGVGPAVSDKIADDDRFIELIPITAAVDFEYLKMIDVEGTLVWQPVWDMKKDLDLPLAVRITLKETITSSPIRVVSRIIPRLKK